MYVNAQASMRALALLFLLQLIEITEQKKEFYLVLFCPPLGCLLQVVKKQMLPSDGKFSISLKHLYLSRKVVSAVSFTKENRKKNKYM